MAYTDDLLEDFSRPAVEAETRALSGTCDGSATSPRTVSPASNSRRGMLGPTSRATCSNQEYTLGADPHAYADIFATGLAGQALFTRPRRNGQGACCRAAADTPD
jgi:hypothetical protein